VHGRGCFNIDPEKPIRVSGADPSRAKGEGHRIDLPVGA
jgi:hypothetical protein